MLGERLLRPAMVNVSQGPDPAHTAVPTKREATKKKKKGRSGGKGQTAESKGGNAKPKRTKKKAHKPKTNKKNS